MDDVTASSLQVGNLFMVGLPGPGLDPSTRSLIVNQRINNFILFKRNVVDPAQLHKLCVALINACSKENLPPPLIAIDQEGGSVSRLPPPFVQFEGARQLAEKPDPVAALSAYAQVCSDELLKLGINMNLAPVLDVCPAGRGHFMETRCLGGNGGTVAHLGGIVIREMQSRGIAACAKHFPGLGAADLDPHRRQPVVSRSAQQMRSDDLLPFWAAIKTGVAAIMTSHAIYSGLDPGKPATISRRILADLLRRELGYTGLIITDDLEMGAIEKTGPLSEIALKSFTAGADLLLICHDHEKVRAVYQSIAAALAEARITSIRVQQSISRLACLKAVFAPS